MSKFAEQPNAALLVIDVQSGVVDAAHARDQTVANIKKLVVEARKHGIPVIWIQHADDQLVRETQPWQIVPELEPADSEHRLDKHFGDAFEATDLGEVLTSLSVGRLYIVGAQTDACIRSTLHGAFVRGFDTILVGDAHTTEDQTQWGAPSPDLVIAHTNLYWNFQSAPGRVANVVATMEVDFDPST